MVTALEPGPGPSARLIRAVLVRGTGRRSAAMVEAFAHGATDFMTEPFGLSQFRARVCSWLMRSSDG